MARRVKFPTVGDYVLVSKYSDRSPFDTWCVGILSKVEMFKNGNVLYSVFDGDRSYFKCCWLITKKEGDEIIKSGHPAGVSINKMPKKAQRPGNNISCFHNTENIEF